MSKVKIYILLLCLGLFIGNYWKQKDSREQAEFNQSIMTFQRFMELNPYFSNEGVCVNFKAGTPAPMFNANTLSYRLFIKPFKFENGEWSGQNQDIEEESVDVCKDNNSGFEDWTPIRDLHWNGYSLIITKDFSKWELQNVQYPKKWNLILIQTKLKE